MRGITFGNKHSYTDFNLVLTSVNIPPATPKTNSVDIPGGDGSIDLSEALGEIKYADRECEFVFTVFPTDNWEEKKTAVSNYLNGKVMQIKGDTDPTYYWEGRCFIDNYASDKNIHKITVKAMVDPYKYKIGETFVSKSGNTSFWLENTGRKTVIPTITTTTAASITVSGLPIAQVYNLNAGTHKLLDLRLETGVRKLITLSTTGTITFKWREGDL